MQKAETPVVTQKLTKVKAEPVSSSNFRQLEEDNVKLKEENSKQGEIINLLLSNLVKF